MSSYNPFKFYGSKSSALADNEAGHDNMGGRISADELVSLAVRPSLLTGTKIVSVAGKNGAGTGILRFVLSNSTLVWQSPRDTTFGTPITVSAGNVYTLESSTPDCWVKVDFISPSAQDLTVPIVIEQNRNVFFPDVGIKDSMYGLVDYCCIFARNTNATLFNLRPHIPTMAAPVAIAAKTNYDPSGEVRITLATTPKFPSTYFIRNVRSGEIMYYTARGSRGRELVVPSLYRGLRGTSQDYGDEGDLIELVSPLDFSFSLYANPETKIIDPKAPPFGTTFSYPIASQQDPQTKEISGVTLNPATFYELPTNAVIAIWMRRSVPPGAVNISDVPLRLGFLYEVA